MTKKKIILSILATLVIAIFAVVAGTDHALFCEFGTGQRGLDTPYPHPLPKGVSWDYATGKTIRKNAVTGRYYWFYQGRTDYGITRKECRQDLLCLAQVLNCRRLWLR